MFFRRSYEKELMDDFSIADERVDAALKELKTINKFLGGNSVSKEGIKKINKSKNADALKILDAGGGASDILLSINSHPVSIYNVDLNKRISFFARKNSDSLKVICADLFNSPFKEKAFDVVHASLFFHHFREDEIKILLKEFEKIALKAIIINDLRRSLPAYLGIKILTALFSKSELVKNDGPLSVKRAFVKKDLIEILSSRNFKNFEIKRKWAFRWLVVIYL